MVIRPKKAGAKKGRVKIKKLNLNAETVKNLTASEQKKMKGGQAVIPIRALTGRALTEDTCVCC